jgi:hypothetical protein
MTMAQTNGWFNATIRIADIFFRYFLSFFFILFLFFIPVPASASGVRVCGSVRVLEAGHLGIADYAAIFRGILHSGIRVGPLSVVCTNFGVRTMCRSKIVCVFDRKMAGW